MADSPRGSSSFWTQANALLRKNLTFQKRNVKTNIRLILFPFFVCLLLVIIQAVIDKELDKPKNKCGCICTKRDGDKCLQEECGIQHSDTDQVATCAVPNPPEWPPMLQVPAPEYRAVRTDIIPFPDLPNDSCRRTGSCPVTFLFTGNNQSFGETLFGNMFKSPFRVNTSDIVESLARNVLGSASMPQFQNFLDPAFLSNQTIYYLQTQCPQNSSFSVPIQITNTFQQEITCAQALHLWRSNSSDVNNELYKGYRKANPERQINEIVAAYDFLNSSENGFNVITWYNSTFKNDTGFQQIGLSRVPRSVNLVSNAFLQFLQGPGTEMLFEFVKEMPKLETPLRIDVASLLGSLFFTWVFLQLFPVFLTSLVYEKEKNLRIMMKMHGLGDGPYWMISYGYFFSLSVLYVLCFVIFGSIIGLKFFRLNDYSIQFVFYFLFINLQISLAFLVATMFSNVKTATVIAYIGVFASGLLGGFLFSFFVEDTSFPSKLVGRGIITIHFCPSGLNILLDWMCLFYHLLMASCTTEL